MAHRLTIDAQFCGPPGLGNGGYVCGVLAAGLDGAATVTLRKGTPLGRPLDRIQDDDGARLLDGDTLLAEARATAFALDVPAAPRFEQALAASARYPGFAQHSYPLCFGCGHARDAGDGLRVMPGPLDDDGGLLAAAWVPDAAFAGADGRVRPEFLWAALDCPGGWAVIVAGAQRILLGRLTAQLEPRVRAGERCTVLAWPLAQDGRKRGAGTALYGADGRLVGSASALWIELPDPPAGTA